MRYYGRVAAACALFAIGGKASGQSISVNFDSATDLDSFSQRTGGALTGGAAPVSTALQYSVSAGISGSGGLIRSGAEDVTAVYQPISFDLGVNSVFTLSMFFRTGTNINAANGNALQLGFLASNALAFNNESGNAFISIRLNDDNNSSPNATPQGQIKTASGSTANTMGTSSPLTENTWYQLVGTIAKSSTANTFNFSVRLENWGSDGAAFVSNSGTALSSTFTNAELYSDTSVYAGFRQASGAVAAVDSFTVVPEPGTAVLLLGGMGMLGLVRKRR